MSPVRKKLVIIGDGTCGKTCLLTVFSSGEFPGEYVQTIHEISTKVLKVDDKEVEFILYDTAGQEDYDNLRRMVYPGTDVILICFSVISYDSYDNIKSKWIKEVNHFAPKVPIILVGTKTDLRDDQKTLNELKEENKNILEERKGHKLAEKIGAFKYVECSAKENKGVQRVFENALFASFEERTGGIRKWLCF